MKNRLVWDWKSNEEVLVLVFVPCLEIEEVGCLLGREVRDLRDLRSAFGVVL